MPAVTVRRRPGVSDGRKAAIVVPKRIARTAVARNALKRRIRAIVARDHEARRRLVVIARPEALLLSFEDLSREVLRAIRENR
jgi:ribonuclease P protein component